MLFSGARRLLYVSLVMLVVLQVCQVGAIRVFPANAVPNVEFNNKGNEDLFSKYFSGRTHLVPTNTTQKSFGESKRRVPSCPDPLHN
ncbi:hypothetical protein Fmac_023142 [Flemingia macrophylla]|uniref:Uncharacterized protein n=1 Tax=Flemingia macrophylla TaxID=520843 RepID=A0ABD1LKP8_9FABA